MASEAIYLNDWSESGEAGMLSDFGITADALAGAEVLVASYTYEYYSGDAYVLFRRDGKLWEVHGGHCSCYGLSESDYAGDTTSQWEPEETTIEAVLHRINHAAWGEDGKVADAVRAALATPQPAEAQGLVEAAYHDARRLAVILWEKHYKDSAPHWQPLEGIRGVISQIDNMIAGFPAPPAPADNAGLVEELEELLAEIGTLPLSEWWMYSAIRHCQRNMDIDYEDEGCPPDRQSGTALAKLVNRLPRILSALRANGAEK